MFFQQKYNSLTSENKLVSVVRDLHNISSTLKQLPSSISASYLEENRLLNERKRKIEYMFSKIDKIRGTKNVEEVEMKLQQANKTILFLENVQKNNYEEISTLKTTLQERDEQLSSLNNEVCNLKETIVQLDYELKLSKGDTEQFKKQLKTSYYYQSGEIDKLSLQLMNKTEEIQSLQVEKSDEIAMLNKQLEEKDVGIEDLKEVLKSNEKKDDEIAKLKQIIKDFQSALDESEDEVDNDPLKEFNEIKEQILGVVE